MTDFYLTLPSNTNPENRTCEFSVHLPTKLSFKGQWEVALVEIQYPYSWNNIFGPPDNQLADNWIDIIFPNNFIATVFIPPGYYGTIQELLAAIEYGKHQASKSLANGLEQQQYYKVSGNSNEEETNSISVVPLPPEKEYKLLPRHVKDINTGFFFKFNETLKRTKYKKAPTKIKYIELSERLQYMLGFEKQRILEEKKIARYAPDLRGGFYALHVYCNLVEPQIVGDTLVPLLRCVHVDGIHGDIIEKIFDSPHYVPVLAKEIDRIDIAIKDDRNQFVPFDFGKVVVKLHFRKRRTVVV